MARINLRDTLRARYFPGKHDQQLQDSLDQLLSSVHAGRRTYLNGPLRQTLVISCLNPTAPSFERAWRSSRAVVRLQLANGLLYGLHLKGNVQYGLAHLESMAAWLTSQPYDVDAFERYEVSLATLVGEAQDGSTCEIHLAKVPSLLPPIGISRVMILKITLGALNTLRKRYGLRPLNRLPRLLEEHIATRLADIVCGADAYLAGLEPAAVTTIRDFHGKYHHRYDDLKVYNFFVADGGKFCRNRVQAVQQFPWLLRILAGMDDMHSYSIDPTPPARRTDPRVTRDILHAIDTGKPLLDAVALACKVPRETVRWTRGHMLPNVRQFSVPRVELLLQLLSWIPPEKRPSSEGGWAAMRELVCATLPILGACSDKTTFPTAMLNDPRYGLAMTHWMRELTRPTLVHAGEQLARWRRVGHDPADAQDYVSALLRALQRFCDTSPTAPGDPAVASRDAMLDWLSTISVHRLMALSRHWHVRVGEQMPHASPSTGSDSREPVSWPAVLAEPIQIQSLHIVELVTSHSLAQEGSAMDHCVGGYTWRCSGVDSLILSIRDTDGQRLSTAELIIDGDSLRVSVRQHKGRRNLLVPVACEEALRTLVLRLNSPAYQDSLKRRHDFQRMQRYARATRTQRAGLEVEDYCRIEEQTAWLCTFGFLPAEKSVNLNMIRQPQPAPSARQRAASQGGKSTAARLLMSF